MQPEHGEALSYGGQVVAIRQLRRQRRLAGLAEWLAARFLRAQARSEIRRWLQSVVTRNPSGGGSRAIAVADPFTGVWIYDTNLSGWLVVGGTSVSI